MSASIIKMHRLVLVLLFFVAWSALIVYRLIQLQVVHSDDMRVMAVQLQRTEESIPAQRGEFRDINGNLLAVTHMTHNIFLDPQTLENPDAILDRLANLLGKDNKWRKRHKSGLKEARANGRYYYPVANNIPEEAKDELERDRPKGLHFKQDPKRAYPMGWLGSHIVGFVNRDGRFKEGVEASFDDLVKGEKGRRRVSRDGKRRRIGLGSEMLQTPVEGQTVTLTIDRNIQYFVETSIRKAHRMTGARNVTAIVIDPYTGAIKAMANVPDFNPNSYSRSSAFERKNRAVVDIYEPASAFKIVTVASALDLGKIHLGDVFFCERGKIKVADKWIRDHKSFGNLSVREILWHSSNVGSVKVALTMTPGEFHHYIEMFGFGSKTGIDLPAESSGILHPLSAWKLNSPAYLSMGHEISSTPLQMLLAACVVANGGYLIQPYVGAFAEDADGNRISLVPGVEKRRVIKESTSRLMKDALEGVVLEGTAKAAQIPNVSVFGKTGTAQRIEGNAYSNQNYNASFVGFFPKEQPVYGIIVVLHDPRGGKVHGGEVAAPVFGEIAGQIVQYDKENFPELRQELQVAASEMPESLLTRKTPAAMDGKVPDVMGLGLRHALFQLKQAGLKVEFKGSGKVWRQVPEAGDGYPKNGICQLVLRGG